MIQVVWEFVVKQDALEAFAHEYGPDGAWCRLFAGQPGYRGTTLLRDSRNARRFLTIDAWDTTAQRDEMLARCRTEYAELDAACAGWTESETELGIFEVA